MVMRVGGFGLIAGFVSFDFDSRVMMENFGFLVGTFFSLLPLVEDILRAGF